MKTFKDYLLGPTDPALFSACIFFAAVGVLFILLLGTRLRDPKSTNSPSKFSWSYLWSDNAKRIGASSLAVLISLRFMPEVLGWELSPFKALCVGVGWDGIALFVKQKTNFLDKKV